MEGGVAERTMKFGCTLDSFYREVEEGNVKMLEEKRDCWERQYLDGVQLDLQEVEFAKKYISEGPMQLNDLEMKVLKQNGFVVSERLGSKSFGEAYLAIFNEDLPVFITPDSLLHCWHYSYDKILDHLELTFLSTEISNCLKLMHNNLLKITKNVENRMFSQVYDDTELFITVALYLLEECTVKEVDYDSPYRYIDRLHNEVTVSLNPAVNQRIEEVIEAIEEEKIRTFQLFGKDREVDFSQFKPRGHYEQAEDLQRYFKCMMWLGRIDLRIAGGDDGDSSLIELGCALLMFKLITASPEGYEKWSQFDDIMQKFIGNTDSLTFKDIYQLQKTIKDQDSLKDNDVLFSERTLTVIQQDILNSDLGKQTILSHIYAGNLGEQSKKLPRSFSLMGQRFTIDSWVLSKLVHPTVQLRFIPSCVDVGYSVFNNDTCAKIIEERIKKGEMKWRDVDYSQQLEATQRSVNSVPEDVWKSNLYTLWLKAIRTLSNASSSPNFSSFPKAMKTKAWAHHDLNTQMASWTQLRHDTLLYVKQSYGIMTLCDYPFGFVDPRVEFWDVLIELGLKMQQISAITNIGVEWSLLWTETIQKIRDLAQKQINQVPFTTEQATWIKSTISKWYQNGSGGGWRRDGWYCNLFYNRSAASEEWSALISDVHTAPPSPLFPGAVLSEAVGNVNMLIGALDNGGDIRIYAGPVFSHYEIVPLGVVRYSDLEWKEKLSQRGKESSPALPVGPPWTRDHVVSGVLPKVDRRVPSTSGSFSEEEE